MADTHMNNASWEFVDSFHETNQAVADHYVAVQDRNLHVAQNLFLMGAEAMESQTKTTRHLLNQWTQALSKQQKAFHTLVNATLNVYLECLRLHARFYAFRRLALHVRTDFRTHLVQIAFGDAERLGELGVKLR